MIESIIKTIPILSKLPFEALEIKMLSGLSNENYLISIQEKGYVLRVPRQSTNKFINRNNEAHNAKIAQQLGISPNCLWRGKDDQEGISLTEFIKNTNPIKSDNQEDINALAKILTNLQSSKKPFKGRLDNIEITEKLKQYFELCSAKQQENLNSNYQKAVSLLETPLCNRPNVPSHVDLIAENILQQDDKVWFIDWEYSAMASPFWDIAIFCNSADYNSEQSKVFLKQMIDSYDDNDFIKLKNYRFITNVISNCWIGAFSINTHRSSE